MPYKNSSPRKISASLHFTQRQINLLKPLSGICLANISAEDITVYLQETDYVISVKQMTAKRPTPDGGVTYTSLFLFLLRLARNQQTPEIFKLTTLCDIIIKVEACRS
jgi:hypothetical protein